MSERAYDKMTVHAFDSRQVPRIAAEISNNFDARISVVRTNSHSEIQLEAVRPAEEYRSEEGSLNLEVDFDQPRVSGTLDFLKENFTVAVHDLITNSLGVTEGIECYREYYQGSGRMEGRGLDTDYWVNEILETGHTLRPWDELDEEGQDRFIETVDLYSEGNLFLSPEMTEGCATLEEALELHREWLISPSQK